jgi:hypothetical protein
LAASVPDPNHADADSVVGARRSLERWREIDLRGQSRSRRCGR